MLGILDDEPPASTLFLGVDYEPSLSQMLIECILRFIKIWMSFFDIISFILRKKGHPRIYPIVQWPIESVHWRSLK